MGGALCLHLSLNLPLAGVVSLSAPIFSLAGWRVRLVPLVRFFKPFAKKRRTGVKNESARQLPVGYTINPLHAVNELLKFMRHMRECVRQVKVPLLIIHSTDDPIVPASNARDLYEAVASEDKRVVWLTDSYHIITIDNEKQRVFEEVVGFLRSHGGAMVRSCGPPGGEGPLDLRGDGAPAPPRG